MDQVQKLHSLQKLDETALRGQVLIPLLGRMGMQAATEYHGAREHGKDIVCFDVDRLGERRYLSVVAKTGDISGSISSSSGLGQVVAQIEQSFNEPYHDLFGMRSVTMDEVWVVTSGRVIPGAADTVMGKLSKTNLDKRLRIIWGERLVDRIDEHYPTYWNGDPESLDNLRGERDRLVQFLRNLLRKMGTDDSNISAVLSELANSPYWMPKVEVLNNGQWVVRRANAYAVEIAEAGEHYTRGLYSDHCGEITKALRKAQKAVEDHFFSVEELVDSIAKAVTTNDPWEFVTIYESHIEEHWSHFHYFGSDQLRYIEYLIDGLNDVDEFLERLNSRGLRKDTLQLALSVQLLAPQIAEYLKHVDSDSFRLFWTIVRKPDNCHVSFSYDSQPSESTEYFSTSHNRLVGVHSWDPPTLPISVTQVVEAAQEALRKHLETDLVGEPVDCAVAN
jgi:hypothetical protein